MSGTAVPLLCNKRINRICGERLTHDLDCATRGTIVERCKGDT